MIPSEKGPLRTCVACRKSQPQNQLVRYVVAPDEQLVVDYRHRLPGRGAYTCIDPDCLKKAIDRKQFQRNLRSTDLRYEYETIKDQLCAALEQRIVNLLGMGRKSNQVVTGSHAVMTALRHKDELSLIVMAEDISVAIADKIQHLSSRRNVACVQMLGKDLLGQIMGKSERSVVAVHKGNLADAILVELQRYKQMVREN